MRCLNGETRHNLIVKSSESNPNIYFSNMAIYAENFEKQKKNLIFLGENFYYAFLTDITLVDEKKL